MLSYFAAVIFAIFALIACGNAVGDASEIVGIYAQDVYVEYDGNEHGITVNNVIDGDMILYKAVSGSDWTENPPSYIFPGVYEIEYKVERRGCNDFIGMATVTIVKAILGGISSPTETIICDGLSHGIKISGLQPTDGITYSTDGFDFSLDEPKWTDVGEYTVYFIVERDYAEYCGSGVLVILPDISGRYLNASFGIIELTSSGGTANGESITLEYDCSGAGKLGEDDFQVSNGILSYKGEEYTRITDDATVYAIKVNDERLYFLQEDKVDKLAVKINSNGADITYNGKVLMTVSGVNYCETGIVTDYVGLAFEVALAQSETEVVFSLRERQPEKDLTEITVYDGKEHTFDLGADYLFLTERESYVEAGKYTATVVESSDVFLPEVRTATLVILPDIIGVYLDGTTVIQITEERATKNFTEIVLDKTVDGWEAEGKTVVVIPDGIEIDGNEYVRVEDRAILIEVGGITYTTQFEGAPDSFMSVRKNGGVIEIICDGQTIAEIPFDGSEILTVNGESASFVDANGVATFVLGASEMDSPIVRVIIEAE